MMMMMLLMQKQLHRDFFVFSFEIIHCLKFYQNIPRNKQQIFFKCSYYDFFQAF